MEGEVRPKRSWVKWLLGMILLVGFAGVFAWGYITPKPVAVTTSGTRTQVGTYSTYSYVLTTTDKRKERSAEFSPALADEDAVVVGALELLMQVAYGDSKDNEVQPEVEVIHEKPYITYPYYGHKTLFQLYKNEAGEVGSVKFWRESK